MSQQLATPIIFSSNYLGNHNPYELVFGRDRTTKFDQPDCNPMKKKKKKKTETEQVKML